jgi:hypothetical protein
MVYGAIRGLEWDHLLRFLVWGEVTAGSCEAGLSVFL